MHPQSIPPFHNLTFQSPKHKSRTMNDSFRTDSQKFHRTENSQDDEVAYDRFGKTQFRNKSKKMQMTKYTPFAQGQTTMDKRSLWMIDQKMKKHAVCSDRDRLYINTRSQNVKFPGLQTAKNARFKSPKPDSAQQQHDNSSQSDQRPLTLKKRITMIRKHKQQLQKQFQQRKASLEYNERSLSKQSYRLQCYKSKLQKVKTVREQRSRERVMNSVEITLHNEELMRRNTFLKETVLGGQENLRNSRMSLCVEKFRLASETRVQKLQNMDELRTYQNQFLMHKKQQCSQVKGTKQRAHQSVEGCQQGRIITVNQYKLQQISKELVSLQSQMVVINLKQKTQNRFYSSRQVNDSYQNKIKSKKVELQQKAKVYKASLMLELNKSQRISHQAKPEEHAGKEQDCAKTEVYPKKKDELETSTSAELNFTSTKSNCIYKRWNNPLIADRLKTEPNL